MSDRKAIQDAAEITALRDTNEELRVALARTKRIFAAAAGLAGIAHDARNCLCAVAGGLLLECEKPGRGIERSHLRKAATAIDRVATQLGNILAMKPAVLTDKVPGVQVDSITRQMTELVAPLYKLVGVTLERYIDIDIPTISASSAGIASIILELLTSSLKACQLGDSVRIKTVLEAGDIVVEISDTARKSIDKSSGKLKTRSSLAVITEKPGSGLGLDMIERIARAHGSQIEAEARSGKGSIYRLRLPISQRRRAEAAQSSTEKRS